MIVDALEKNLKKLEMIDLSLVESIEQIHIKIMKFFIRVANVAVSNYGAVQVQVDLRVIFTQYCFSFFVLFDFIFKKHSSKTTKDLMKHFIQQFYIGAELGKKYSLAFSNIVKHYKVGEETTQKAFEYFSHLPPQEKSHQLIFSEIMVLCGIFLEDSILILASGGYKPEIVPRLLAIQNDLRKGVISEADYLLKNICESVELTDSLLRQLLNELITAMGIFSGYASYAIGMPLELFSDMGLKILNKAIYRAG